MSDLLQSDQHSLSEEASMGSMWRSQLASLLYGHQISLDLERHFWHCADEQSFFAFGNKAAVTHSNWNPEVHNVQSKGIRLKEHYYLLSSSHLNITLFEVGVTISIYTGMTDAAQQESVMNSLPS